MTKLSTADLATETVELLPSRDTMVLNVLSANIAGVVAANTAAALNVGTALSAATAVAGQSINVVQL
ncbi:hypothetical protein [Sinomonas sp. B1-1]|uniref:hypothetical protein n=1 Tax=Sinomonas sp. B1-1 TaxID=3141454 RepID=UPI003D2BC5F3